MHWNRSNEKTAITGVEINPSGIANQCNYFLGMMNSSIIALSHNAI